MCRLHESTIEFGIHVYNWRATNRSYWTISIRRVHFFTLLEKAPSLGKLPYSINVLSSKKCPISVEFLISRTFKIRSRSRDCDRHFKTTWEFTKNLREFYHTFTNIFFIIKLYNIVNLFPNTMNCNSEGFIKINCEKCQVLSEFNTKENVFIGIILNSNIKNKWFKFSSHKLRFDLNNCLTVSGQFMPFF